jgi:hypothetical protein
MSSCSGSSLTSKFLGLDISTSCTGICILDQNKELVLLDNIRLDKCSDFFEKCTEVKKYLDVLKTEHLIQNIFIEQDLQAFRPGLSSAATINTLARFNGAVTFMAYQTFGIRPDLINVTKARSAVGLKINHKDKTKTTKDKVFDWVSSEIDFDWPKKKTGSIKTSCYDMSDAYVICRAGINLLNDGKLYEDDI